MKEKNKYSAPIIAVAGVILSVAVLVLTIEDTTTVNVLSFLVGIAFGRLYVYLKGEIK